MQYHDLRVWLNERDTTQTELARAVKLSPNYVASICRGDLPMTALFRLNFLSAYGIDPVTVAMPVISDATTPAQIGEAAGEKRA